MQHQYREKMDTEKEVNHVISELRSGRGSKLYGALIMLRTTLIKSRSALTHLIDLGVVKLLIVLLEQHQRHGNASKTTDIIMSILANMCLEEDVRQKVADCDGINVIARVTMASEQESIQNRGIRALANMSQDADKNETIVGLEVPDFVSKKLMETEDEECRSTYCRALHVFAQTSRGVDRLVEDTQAVQALATLLELDNRKLALKSLRTLSELSTKRCCSVFSSQLLGASVLQELVTFADDEDSNFASYSVSIILRLCEQEFMRPALGSAGVVSLLTKLFKSNKVFVNKVSTLNALCLCTKEAVNRKKIHDAGGLELLMAALNDDSNSRFSVLHDRIISSLVNFLYNEDCLARLLDLGLVKTLIQHLRRCCSLSCADWDWQTEIRALAQHRESDTTIAAGTSEGEDDTGCDNISGRESLVAEDKTSSDYRGSSVGDHTMVSHDMRNEDLNYLPSASESVVEFDAGIINPEVDPLIIDSSKATNREGMVVDVSTQKPESSPLSESSDELPLPSSSSSRHTYSINSPTYQAETSWKLEDYVSGATCKNFSQEQEPALMTPPYMYSAAVADIGSQTPYSPLSAGASYYSPAQSSPAGSTSYSPLRSVSPHSPASSGQSGAGSPTWLLSSPEQQSPQNAGQVSDASPHSHQSPLHLGQFSPLSNLFPLSPGPSFEEADPQSPPIPFSQLTSSMPSQEASHFQTDQVSPRNVRSSDLSDQASLFRQSVSVIPKFVAVPLSQGTTAVGTPVYSASEDEDDNEEDNNDHEASQVKGKTELSGTTDRQRLEPLEKQTSHDCNRIAESASRQLVFSTQPPHEDYPALIDTGPPSSLQDMHIISQQKRSAATQETAAQSTSQLSVLAQRERSPKRRRLNDHTALADRIDHQIQNTEDLWEKDAVASSGNDNKSLCQNYHSPQIIVEREKTGTMPDLRETSSSFEISSSVQTISITPSVSGSQSDNSQQNLKKPQHLTSVQLKKSLSSQAVKRGTIKRMSSFPTACKRQKDFSSSPDPGDKLSLVPPTVKLGASPLISDSPYRSPFSEHALSPRLDHAADQPRQNDRKINSVKMKSRPGTSTSSRAYVAETSALTVDEKHDPPMSNTARPRGSATAALASRTQTNHAANDDRVQKILRATESNILILLARVSVKTNPVQFLAETSVMSTLLGYIGSAPNPIRRCCRILYRVCSNPLCFDKLMLLPVPVLFVQSLILNEDGSFPPAVFPGEGEHRITWDLFPSSQGSEGSGSQASEFGRKMDFEFGGDAYSRMASQRQSSIGALFREGPSLSIDSQSARDVPHGARDIYDTGLSRKETRVRIGLELLRTMAVVAMSPYGEGEIKHILSRSTQQDKLACAISLLHLRVGWGHFLRRQLPINYKLWDQLLPCLFIPEAQHAREAIVTGICLNLQLDKPPKQVKEILTLHSCPQFVSQETGPISSKANNNCALPSSSQDKYPEHKTVKHSKIQTQEGESETAPNSESVSDIDNYILVDEDNEEMDFDSDSDKNCAYKFVSHRHDLHFVVHEGKTTRRLGVCKKLLTGKSEMFAAMLGGAYAESSKSEIEIFDVSTDSLEFILHYLHGCVMGCPVIDCLRMAISDLKSRDISPPISHETSFSTRVTENVQKGKSRQSPKLEGGNAQFQAVELDVGNSVSVSSVEPENMEGFLSREKDVKGDTLSSKVCPCEMGKDSFLQSEDSLSSLTLGDKPEYEEEAPSTLRKPYARSFVAGDGCSTEGGETRTHEGDESKVLQRIEVLLNKCVDILALADRFLLTDLLAYPTSVLSHTCLCPHTAEDIFHLACFYKLDSLAVDCVREIIMSSLPNVEIAKILLDLAQEGLQQQVQDALMTLLNALTV